LCLCQWQRLAGCSECVESVAALSLSQPQQRCLIADVSFVAARICLKPPRCCLRPCPGQQGLVCRSDGVSLSQLRLINHRRSPRGHSDPWQAVAAGRLRSCRVGLSFVALAPGVPRRHLVPAAALTRADLAAPRNMGCVLRDVTSIAAVSLLQHHRGALRRHLVPVEDVVRAVLRRQSHLRFYCSGFRALCVDISCHWQRCLTGCSDDVASVAT
jgi:hypothetical protein